MRAPAAASRSMSVATSPVAAASSTNASTTSTPAIERPPHLTQPVDQRETRPLPSTPLAQLERRANARIARARDRGSVGRAAHGRVQRAIAPSSSRRPVAARSSSVAASASTPERVAQPFREPVGRQARRVGRQQHEPGVSARERRKIGQQRHEVELDAPWIARRTVPVGRRVDDEPVVAAATPDLACHERAGVVDQPADGRLGEAGARGVAAGPRDRGPGGVHVRHPRARRRGRERRAAGVREQREDLRRDRVACVSTGGRRDPLDRLADPRPQLRVLGEHADLPAARRSQLELQRVPRDDPWRLVGAAGPPPALAARPALEHEVRRRPRGGVSPATVRGRARPVHDPRAEPFEPPAIAGVEELVGIGHPSIVPSAAFARPVDRTHRPEAHHTPAGFPRPH